MALQTAFVEALNRLVENKDEILLGYEALTDTTTLEKTR